MARIIVSDRRAGDELAEFFRRSDCSAELVDRNILEVSPRLALLPEAAKLEIEGLLRVWCKLHPEARANMVVSGPADLFPQGDVSTVAR